MRHKLKTIDRLIVDQNNDSENNKKQGAEKKDKDRDDDGKKDQAWVCSFCNNLNKKGGGIEAACELCGNRFNNC